MFADLGNRLRIAALRRAGASVGADVTLSAGARIDAGSVVLGSGCHIAAGALLRARTLHLGEHCYIGPGCRIEGDVVRIGYNGVFFSEVDVKVAGRFDVGDHAKFSRQVTIRGGDVAMGGEFWMNPSAEIGGGGSSHRESAFRAGDRCHVGRASHINVASLVSLGDDTAVGMDCTLATHAQWQAWTDGYPRRRAPIRLGSSVALYSRSVIAPGVTIGNGAVVAAGSVVLGDVEEGMLVGGVPARVVRPARRDCDRLERLQVLLAEFAERQGLRTPLEAFDDGVIFAPGGATPIVVAATAAAHTRVAALAKAIVLVPDAAMAAVLREAADCVFDVDAKVLYGNVSRTSEALRNFLFSSGLRFRYHGYRRDRLDHAALVAAGLERP